MSSIKTLDDALGGPDGDDVILPDVGGGHLAGRTWKFHRQPDNGDLRPACGNFGGDGVAMPRAFAEAQGFEPCKTCFGGDAP